MSRNQNILFVSTIHRMSERIIPAIADYHERHGCATILNLGQSSKNTKYSSNKRYLNYIDNRISKKISVYHGNGISNKRDVRSDEYCNLSIRMISEICNTHKIDSVVLDDSRKSHLNLKLGKFCSQNRIKLYANSHGNIDVHEADEVYCLSKPFYHKLFVFGKHEVEKYSSLYFKDKYISGGIPENDETKNAKRDPKKITVIVNRVVVDGQPTERLFDSSVFSEIKISELQKLYKLPVVFKIKHRMSEDTQRDIDHLRHSIPSNIDYEIVTHLEDEIDFLSDSKVVLTYGSTMSFKSLQLGIPTVIFKELGPVGLFSNYAGTVSLGQDYIHSLEDLPSKAKDFLPEVLEGSLTFDATQKYSDNLASDI